MKEVNYSSEGKPGLHFLDSGAFTLFNREVRKNKKINKYEFFDSEEFQNYVDNYAKFVSENLPVIDYYANVDAIRNPEKTWEVQKYIEQEYGLKPVPVVHVKTDLKWLDRYLEEGYDFIALGGFYGVRRSESVKWLDKVFTKICPESNGYLPLVKTHGFAITGLSLLLRYPWFSVDSTSWVKAAAFGCVFVPKMIQGEYAILRPPRKIEFGKKSSDTSYNLLTPNVKREVDGWADLIGIPIGKGTDGAIIEKGLVSYNLSRWRANIHYYQALTNALPDYPWPFQHAIRNKGFQLL